MDFDVLVGCEGDSPEAAIQEVFRQLCGFVNATGSAIDRYEHTFCILSYHQGADMHRQKITVTIEQELVKEIDRTAGILNKSRSCLVEEAIRTWRRVRLERGLREGYLAMTEEDLVMAEENLSAGYEAQK
jgi:predicted transcriptional regulator